MGSGGHNISVFKGTGDDLNKQQRMEYKSKYKMVGVLPTRIVNSNVSSNRCYEILLHEVIRASVESLTKMTTTSEKTCP